MLTTIIGGIMLWELARFAKDSNGRKFLKYTKTIAAAEKKEGPSARITDQLESAVNLLPPPREKAEGVLGKLHSFFNLKPDKIALLEKALDADNHAGPVIGRDSLTRASLEVLRHRAYLELRPYNGKHSIDLVYWRVKELMLTPNTTQEAVVQTTVSEINRLEIATDHKVKALDMAIFAAGGALAQASLRAHYWRTKLEIEPNNQAAVKGLVIWRTNEALCTPKATQEEVVKAGVAGLKETLSGSGSRFLDHYQTALEALPEQMDLPLVADTKAQPFNLREAVRGKFSEYMDTQTNGAFGRQLCQIENAATILGQLQVGLLPVIAKVNRTAASAPSLTAYSN